MSKPLILVSNDDGINANGVHALVDFISDRYDAEIVVVCPDSPRSGHSAAITCDSPLKVTDCGNYRGARMWSVSGTPVDCVKLAIHELLNGRRPDLLLSGINHGSNSATSVTYSGTMGCAIEGCVRGIPSVGFSLLDHSADADFAHSRETIARVVDAVIASGLPERVCLNVNIPAQCTPAGIKIVRGARGYWSEEYKKYTDPHGRPFYWLTGAFHNIEPDSVDTDEYWLSRGWSTVVPVSVDMTACDAIAGVSAMFA